MLKMELPRDIEPRPIAMEKMPSENVGAEEVAKEVIEMLDGRGLSREQVYAVAIWIKFMATQG